MEILREWQIGRAEVLEAMVLPQVLIRHLARREMIPCSHWQGCWGTNPVKSASFEDLDG